MVALQACVSSSQGVLILVAEADMHGFLCGLLKNSIDFVMVFQSLVGAICIPVLHRTLAHELSLFTSYDA